MKIANVNCGGWGAGGGGAFLNTMPNNDAEKGNQSAKFVTKYLGEGKKLI